MRALAWEGQTSPLVRQFAIETLRRVKPKDSLSEVGALYHSCCREIHYLADPLGSEFLQHPEVTVRTAAGDCDDMDGTRYPGARWYVDADNDGFGAEDHPIDACGSVEGAVPQVGDCDDDDDSMNSKFKFNVLNHHLVPHQEIVPVEMEACPGPVRVW